MYGQCLTCRTLVKLLKFLVSATFWSVPVFSKVKWSASLTPHDVKWTLSTPSNIQVAGKFPWTKIKKLSFKDTCSGPPRIYGLETCPGLWWPESGLIHGPGWWAKTWTESRPTARNGHKIVQVLGKIGKNFETTRKNRSNLEHGIASGLGWILMHPLRIGENEGELKFPPLCSRWRITSFTLTPTGIMIFICMS